MKKNRFIIFLIITAAIIMYTILLLFNSFDIENQKDVKEIELDIKPYNSNTFEKKDLTEFERAFQEVSYAYYMRGPYLHYNVSKGIGNVISPEQSTSQNYNYMACTLFVNNVYKELLGIDITSFYGKYAMKNIGKRKEIIGYGELQKNGELYWYDGTKDENNNNKIAQINPDANYLLSQLKIGDILHTTGHDMLIYDLIYDDNGNVIDVYIIHSTAVGSYKTKSKTHARSYIYNLEDEKVNLNIGHGPWSNLYYNYYEKDTLDDEPIIEGTLKIQKFSDYVDSSNALNAFNMQKDYYDDYAIIRLASINEENIEVLNFDGNFTYGGRRIFAGDTINDKEIEFSDSVKSRVKYNKLFIEKTVNKGNNNIVEANDELIYKIKIKNNSNETYLDDLIIKEDLSEYVDFISYECKKNNVDFKKENNHIEWNIGKINSNEEVYIEYKVKVKKGYNGSIIKSTGKVDNIPSGDIENTIGINIDNDNNEKISESFEKFKNTFSGKKLVNEIYKDVFNKDIELENFKIQTNNLEDEEGLIYFNNKWGEGTRWESDTYMLINKKDKFSKMVLNNYFNSLYKNEEEINSYNNIKIVNFSLPALALQENNPDNRADTIYPTDFKTGDILIYVNTYDNKYSLQPNTHNTQISNITYENGEYCYIYIEGKGFVGVNIGEDGISGTSDDRNEFNSNYYVSNGLTFYERIDVPKPNDELKEWLQYQSLFGKDSYVILRPSLALDLNPMELDISYNTKELTNQNVIVTIEANEKMLEIEGWTLSENERVLTKEYTNNTIEQIELSDYANNKKTVDIKINNIYKIKSNNNMKIIENEDNINYIEDIQAETKIEDFKNNLDINANIEIYKNSIKITDEDVNVATGMIMIIKLENQKKEFTLIVAGDTTGDGKITMGDVLKLARYNAKLDTNIEKPYFKAGDVVKNGKIGMPDILKLTRIVANLEELN